MTHSNTTRKNVKRSKVGRLLYEYNLEKLGEELERRWVGDGRNAQSLRDLADWFNERLLEAKMEAAGMTPLSGEVRNYYHIFTSDEISTGDEIQAQKSLEQAGIDIAKLQDDFVSYGAIHTYLKKYRNASKESNTAEDPVTASLERIQRLQERTNAVSTSVVESLRAADHLAIGDFDVQVNIRVTCKNCNSYYRFSGLLNRSGCECQLED